MLVQWPKYEILDQKILYVSVLLKTGLVHQKFIVSRFMLPVQSIADPIPRFTVDSARYLQSFSAVLHRPNPDLRESTQRAAKFWTSDSGSCVCTHTHTSFLKVPVPVLNFVPELLVY